MTSIWPSLIYSALTLCGAAARIGRRDAVAAILSRVVIWALLYWGSFFDPLIRLLRP
jgi:hypothetical protein